MVNLPDRTRLNEIAVTLVACMDMCVAASSPDTTVAEALRLRRVIKSQLDVCHVLMYGPPAGMMEGTAAADVDGTSVPSPAAASCLTEEVDRG